MNKKVNLFLVALLIGALSFTACKDDDDDDPTDPTPTSGFTFAKLNNKWNYNLVTPMFTDTTASFTVVSSLGNNQWAFLLSLMGASNEDTVHFYVSNDEVGDYPDGTKFTMIKSNSVVNDMFTNIDSNGDTTFRKVTSLGTNVTVPLGTYSCMEVKEWTGTGSPDISTYYVHKTVGFVKVIQPGFTLEMTKKNY